jgi:mono/diheme cytochrome c family protein
MMRIWMVALCTPLMLASCGGNGDGPAEPGPGSGDTSTLADGEQLFLENCAVCHGQDLMGTATGPPFLDDIYEPGHHPDEAFYSAAANGVAAHHWDFGDMPPVPGVTEEDVAKIIDYVREQQRAAGIE